MHACGIHMALQAVKPSLSHIYVMSKGAPYTLAIDPRDRDSCPLFTELIPAKLLHRWGQKPQEKVSAAAAPIPSGTLKTQAKQH